MKCELCGCDCCPDGLPCDRQQSQPEKFHKFCCAMCGCSGDSLDYARFGYDKRKEEKKMEISKYVSPSTGRNPFISAADVSAKGTKFKIEDVNEAPKTMKYSDLMVTLSNGKKKFAWGLAFSNFTTSDLAGRFGTNTDKWKGKTVTLITVPGKKKGQKYINLAD